MISAIATTRVQKALTQPTYLGGRRVLLGLAGNTMKGGNPCNSHTARLGVSHVVSLTKKASISSKAENSQYLNRTATRAGNSDASRMLPLRPQPALYLGMCRLRLCGASHPGIMDNVAGMLEHEHNLKIVKLKEERQVAPHGGSILFNMEGLVTPAVAPRSTPSTVCFHSDFLRAKLEALGEDLNCDITLTFDNNTGSRVEHCRTS